MIEGVKIYAQNADRFLVTDNGMWAGSASKDEMIMYKFPKQSLAQEYLEGERQNPRSWYNLGE